MVQQAKKNQEDEPAVAYVNQDVDEVIAEGWSPKK